MVNETQPRSNLSSYVPCEFKVVILGDESVGKTSVLRRYFGNSLEHGDLESTSKPTCMQKEVMYEGRPVYLKIWDTAGDKDMNMAFTGTVDGAIVLYDVTKKETFDSVLKHWVSDLSNADGANVCVIIAGNKIDLQVDNVIPLDQIEGYTRDIGAKHYRISAKDDKNIQELFTDLTKWLMRVKATGNSREDIKMSYLILPSETLDSSKTPLDNSSQKKTNDGDTCCGRFIDCCCLTCIQVCIEGCLTRCFLCGGDD